MPDTIENRLNARREELGIAEWQTFVIWLGIVFTIFVFAVIGMITVVSWVL